MKVSLTLLTPTLLVSTLALFMSHAQGDQSSITEADGYACMGDDKSRKQTEGAALTDAKRNAMEFAKTYIESESELDNFELKKDLVTAFSRADVKVLTIIEKTWQDPKDGDCYTIRIQAEVVPNTRDIQAATASAGASMDPRAPLDVKVWTNQDAFTAGETMKIYLQGNKPFYGRLIYQDASGNNLQLLPNPYRADNYFQGGVIFEIPKGDDKFDLTVQEPFGKEKLMVFASTSPLGPLSTENIGPVYQVKDETAAIKVKTRGLAISSKTAKKTATGTVKKSKPKVSEFAETTVEVTTRAE